MASLSNISAVLHHWIPRNTTRHTIVMAEKVKYNESKSKICIFNDCDNSGGESETNKQQVNFLNHYVHFEFMKHTSMYEQRCVARPGHTWAFTRASTSFALPST